MNARDGCKSLRTATPMTKNWKLKPKDDYTGDLEDIGMHHVEACERVDRFSHMDPKIRIYAKNGVGKCFFQRKLVIEMAIHYRSTIVNKKLMTIGDDHERRSTIMVIVNSDVIMIMIMWQDANVETRS